MDWFVKQIIIHMLVLLCYFSEASSKIKDDLLIINQLANLYNYESIAIFVNNLQDSRNLKMFFENNFFSRKK